MFRSFFIDHLHLHLLFLITYLIYFVLLRVVFFLISYLLGYFNIDMLSNHSYLCKHITNVLNSFSLTQVVTHTFYLRRFYIPY